MDLSQYRPTSYTKDSSWIDNAIATMGEDAFWKYNQKVYDLLDKLEVGQSLAVEDWVAPERFDLFVKIACFYVSESNCNYQINPECNMIKHTFDAREMEKTLALFRRKRENADAGSDGNGTAGEQRGIEVISAPEPPVQSEN